ncbi:hypothetical protein [Sphingobacterium chungjuense]|uniref:hypothetical protein n=1 Tax=Sphingobacterium chungjuense TaxID=2675553 RepID=UPI00140E79E1|nr:hypothetical protein [Sphingobacterium chungjuense]
MTKLINKDQLYVDLFFTLDRVAMGDVLLNVTSDYDKTESIITLSSPITSNERYTAYSLLNQFQDYADGLYTYVLTDAFGILESGSIKIQSEDFGTPNYTSYQSEDDDYIVYDDDQY